jgi:hypothetical protein
VLDRVPAWLQGLTIDAKQTGDFYADPVMTEVDRRALAAASGLAGPRPKPP